jgi:hypothetical protein
LLAKGEGPVATVETFAVTIPSPFGGVLLTIVTDELAAAVLGIGGRRIATIAKVG